MRSPDTETNSACPGRMAGGIVFLRFLLKSAKKNLFYAFRILYAYICINLKHD